MSISTKHWYIRMPCRYNAVQYVMIFYTVSQWLMQNINQSLYLQKTPPNLPSQASYEVSIVNILEKIDRVITPPYCIYRHLLEWVCQQ